MIKKIRGLIRSWLGALSQPFPLMGIMGIPRYIRHWLAYQSSAVEKLRFLESRPCLTDWARTTPFDPHYFFQAAWLARRLAEKRPSRHTDIGSDIRMINVISAFMPVEFLDYRPLPVVLEGLTCGSGNLTALEHADNSICSLSCLHVIEHIGLGRYGDPIDPEGSHKALTELKRVLAKDGRLYISVPVGRERTCFNAHRVFDPHTIISALSGLKLVEFSLIDDAGAFRQHQPIEEGGLQEYGCGLFVFQKPE